jgi:ribonuclease HI
MRRVNIYIAGATAHEHEVFRVRGAAAAVAVLEGVGHRAVAEFRRDTNPLGATITAAALGLETLREPTSVRVVTDSRLVYDVMTGRMRQVGYRESWSRLDRAAVRHRVQWVFHADEYERAALRTLRRSPPPRRYRCGPQ